jgi:transcriptional regulator with XRE-family HTH domain
MPSKATHVLAKLREELGLHQKELAERVGLHWRTIQDIERGKLQLSRRNAIKIGDKLGVSPAWLLQNDTSQEIKNVAGERWSLKDRRTVDYRYPELIRQLLLTRICSSLLSDYLRFRAYFDGLPDAQKVLARWLECQERAWSEFVASHEALGERTKNVTKEQTKLSQNNLGSIRDDIDAISEISWAIETQFEPILPWEKFQRALTRENIERVLPWEKMKEIVRLDKLGQPLPPELERDLIEAASLLVLHLARKEAKTESEDKAAQPRKIT